MPETPKDLKEWKPVPPPEPVTLSGRWVTLEPLSAQKHISALWQAVNGHDEVWQWLADGPYASEADLKAALKDKEKGSAARFYAIVPKSLGTPAGYASLMRIDTANGAIEVGNVLFTPGLQRTQASTEAQFLLAQYVFEELGYRRYEWKCNVLNTPSRKAAERLGFTFEGIFQQHMVVKGKNRDTAWYAMLDSEWPARKTAFVSWLSESNFDSSGRQKRTLRSFSPLRQPKRRRTDPVD